MRYRIWCTVSGGMTGTRQAWLKKKDGKIYETSNKTSATKKAQHLNATMGKNSMVRFRYEVAEV